MKNFVLYIIVSVVGAVILALEILGTRVLGPFYGVSIFLWSALISVTLAALSIGYAVGGRLADNNASFSRISRFLTIAGVWILAIPWMKYPLLSMAEPAGLRFAVLLTATVLFFPPLMLLGMINPFAIKLKALSLDSIGTTAGNLNALSTLASVVSALLTGYVLIPNIGVTVLLLSLGCVLFLTALLGLAVEKNLKRASVPLTIVVFLVALLFFFAPSISKNNSPGLVAVQQSPYGELRTIDYEGQRHLLIDGGIHTRVDTTTWNSTVSYAAVMELPKYFFEKPGKALLIGLGGGSLLKQYRYHFWKVEAVEIDPVVVQIAKEYFHLLPSDGEIVVSDGRQYLASTSKQYDVILLDAFGSSSIPFHLCTKEAFSLISSRLAQGGILAVNVEANGWDDPIITTFSATLKSVFHDVLVLPIEEPPSTFGNLILLASNTTLEPKRLPEDNVTFDPNWRYGPEYQKVHAWDNHFFPDIRNAKILTDEANPVDIEAERINYIARQQLHKYFARTQINVSW
ncbi:MAG: hypothetical protein EPO24_04285 [Bacteroidetes bacterium]|nr:MAG: hypothetical protein EPO24_04285 [Bacteroidota bacterium]